MSSSSTQAKGDSMSPDHGQAAALSLKIFASFDEIEPLWRKLEADAYMSIYQGFRWLQLWHELIGRRSSGELALVVGERNGEPVFIWPFGIWRSGPVRIARWLGGKYNNYNLGIWALDELATVNAQDVMKALREIAASARIDTFELINQPEAWDGQRNPFMCLSHTPSPSNSYLLALEPDFDALYERRRSSRSRRTLRRKRETMEQAGEVRFIHGTDRATILRIVEALVEQRDARAQTVGIPSIFASPGALEMTRDVLLDALTSTEGPLMHAHALEVGGVIRATYIGGIYGERYSCFLNSFRDDELTATSPGDQLLHDLIRSSCENGLRYLDLGIGEERYKTSWCDPDPLFDSFIAMSRIGRLHAQLRGLRQSLKRSIKNNPALWKAVKKARKLRSRVGF